MRRAHDRAVLSRAKPENLWRLALWLGLTFPRCRCTACLTRLVEALAREMIR